MYFVISRSIAMVIDLCCYENRASGTEVISVAVLEHELFHEDGEFVHVVS